MQVTRPNEIQRPGVRLHPKACAALGLEAERATPKRLGTLVPRTCMHALGTGYARKSSEPLGFRPIEGTCASTGAHPSARQARHACGDQPSRCCEAGSDPRDHFWVTWGVYLSAGKPPLADIILSHPPDLTRCDSVIGLAIPAMSGHIQYRGAAS